MYVSTAMFVCMSKYACVLLCVFMAFQGIQNVASSFWFRGFLGFLVFFVLHLFSFWNMFICLFIRNSCDHISTKRIAAPKMILVYNNSKYLRVFQLKKNLEIMVHQPQLSSSYYTWMTQQTNIYLVNLFKSISEKRPVIMIVKITT